MQALAALILVVATAGGTVEVPLDLRLLVEHRTVAPRPRPQLAARYGADWVVVASDVHSSASARRGGPTWRAAVTLTALPDGLGVEIAVELTYLADVRVEREALELRLPAEAVRAVWRDGRLREVPLPERAGPRPGPVLGLVIDRWTPRVCLVRARGVPLMIDGAGAEGMAVRRERGHVTVRLELDDAANHPFTIEPACRPQWRRAGRGVAEGARLRLAGEKVEHRVRLHRSEAPLLVDRLGAGRRAAVVFSDHADQTTAPTLRALLGGDVDPRGPGGGPRGFLGHGLPFTKALFWRNEPGREQLESAAVRDLAARLRAGGGEVALHGPTPLADRRPLTATALQELRDLEVRTWIDHQPPTNCEAFTNRGWRPDPDYGIVDLLAAAGVRYVWAAGPEPRDDFNLLRPREPAARTPFFYPWAAPTPTGRGADLHLFRSAWAYLERERFFRLLAPERLDRLEAERGIAILHTYLEALRREPRLRTRNLMRREPGAGAVALDPRFDGVLAELARRQRAGRLWVTTVRDLGDHLRSVGGLDLRYAPDGAALLRNPGREAVRGATVRLPLAGVRLAAPGAAGERADGEGAELWLDLGPGAAARVTARDAAGRPVSFVEPAGFSFRTPAAAR